MISDGHPGHKVVPKPRPGKTRDKPVLPHRKHLLRRTLGRHPPFLNEAEAVSELEDVAEIVGDDDAGDAGIPDPVAKLRPHPSLSPHIDGSERLVEEEEFRFEHQRPGEGHPLPLPPESRPTLTSARSERCIAASCSATVSAISGRGIFRQRRPNATFPATVMCGKRA